VLAPCGRQAAGLEVHLGLREEHRSLVAASQDANTLDAEAVEDSPSEVAPRPPRSRAVQPQVAAAAADVQGSSQVAAAAKGTLEEAGHLAILQVDLASVDAGLANLQGGREGSVLGAVGLANRRAEGLVAAGPRLEAAAACACGVACLAVASESQEVASGTPAAACVGSPPCQVAAVLRQEESSATQGACPCLLCLQVPASCSPRNRRESLSLPKSPRTT